MLPPNPADKLRDAPLDDLIAVLLKQFKRLLADRDITLTTQAINDIAEAAAKREALPPIGERVRDTLPQFIEESIAVLHDRFGLSFAESLNTDMTSIGGWETTADFLEIANHKSNAELRISSAASLLAMLGDTRYADDLFSVLDADGGVMDVDAMFAKRALSFVTGVAFDADDWESQVRQRIG